MSFASRESFTSPRDPWSTLPVLTRKQLLEKVLEAVTAAEGLAHDYFGGNRKNGLACSLGNAVRMFGNLDVNGEDAHDIAAANDEYPELLPSQRRLVMIEWLHEQLQKIPVQPYFARQS